MNTKIGPSESRISYGGHVCNGLEQNEQTLYLLSIFSFFSSETA
jgi:hypothetical protein